MPELKPYDVVDDNGNATTLLLSQADAVARGLVKGKAADPGDGSAAADPGPLSEYEVPTSYGSTTLLLSLEDAKARGLVGDEPAADEPAGKALRSPANKQRAAANK